MRHLNVIFRGMLIISIICLLMAVGFAVNSILFTNRATTAEGTVINFVEHITKDDNVTKITYRPEVEFFTNDGVYKTFISSVGSNPPQFSVGSKVIVLYYNKFGKMVAEINTIITLWLPSIICFAMGFCFCIIATIGLYFLRTGKSMGVQYYHKLTGKEFFYYFKLNKACPICNGKLTKEKRKIDRGVGVSEWSDPDGGVSYMYGYRYEVKYWYRCNMCEKSFPIEELASGGKK